MRSYNLPFKYPFKIFITLLFIILLFSAQNIFAQSGWQWQNPLPQGNDLKVVKFLNTNYGFAGGDKGSILKTTNGGVNWELTNFNLSNVAIEYLIIIDTNIVYAASGSEAQIFKTTNGGNNWIIIASISPTIDCLMFLNANTGFAIIGADELKKTTDGGFTWTMSYTLSSAIVEINFITEQIGFFTVREYVAPSNNMWRTTDQGATWAPCMTNPTIEQCRKMSFINSTTGYLVKVNTTNYQASILKTTNAGINWFQISQFPGKFQHAFGFNFEMKSDGYGYIGFSGTISSNQSIYRTINSGVSWDSAATLPTIGFFNGFTGQFHYPIFDFPESGTGYYVSNGGYILKTTNNGANWNCQTSIYGNLGPLTKIKFTNENTGYIIGTTGSFFKTTNAGTNWSYSYLGNKNLSSVFFVNNDYGFIGCNYNQILRTTSGGGSWDTINVSSDISFYTIIKSIYFSDVNTGFVTNGGIYKTTNSGLNWAIVIPSGTPGSITSLSFVDEQIGLFCSYELVGFPLHPLGHIYRTSNSGINWFNMTNYDGYINGVNFISTDTGYALFGGTVYKTVNGGYASWFPVLYGIDCNEIKIGPSNLIYGGSFKSTNGGTNWTLYNTKVQSINSIHYINESTGIIVGGNGAGILRTTDGGEIITSVTPISETETPNTFSLHQNYPNPFNPTTKINFVLKNSAFAKLRVFDITGREVRTLINEKLAAGSYSYDFNASELPSGVYFYQIQAEGFIETKKMILLK